MKIVGKQTHPAADLFPMMEEPELKLLAADIKERGLNHPIVLHNGRIIDGRNRGRACEIAGVEPKFVEAHFTGSATAWVLSENLHRRHLTASQRAMIAADALPELEEEAKARQAAALKKGAAKPVSAPVREREDEKGKASKKAAETVGVSSRYVESAKAVASKNPELAQKVRTGEITLKRAEKEIKKAEDVRKARVYVPPQGTYSVLVVDPPWPYEDELDGSDEVRGGLPYEKMSLSQICDMRIPAAENSVLFLWVTNSHLLEGAHVQVLKAWGFAPKQLLTWHKVGRIGVGRILRNQTEHVIIAVKGNPTLNATTQKTIFDGTKREHSRKPEEFWPIVDAICPSKSRVELFAREERAGWVTWGIEKDRFGGKTHGAPSTDSRSRSAS